MLELLVLLFGFISLLFGAGGPSDSAVSVGRGEITFSKDIVRWDGDIDLRAGVRLRAAIAQYKGPKVVALHIDSPGGNVQGGMDLGVVVEELQLDVLVDEQCQSACFLVFVAGKHKIVSKDAKIGIHSAVNIDTDKEDLDSYSADIGIARWLAARKVPYSVIGRFVTTLNSDMALLSSADMEAMSVKVFDLDAPRKKPADEAPSFEKWKKEQKHVR